MSSALQAELKRAVEAGDVDAVRAIFTRHVADKEAGRAEVREIRARLMRKADPRQLSPTMLAGHLRAEAYRADRAVAVAMAKIARLERRIAELEAQR